MRSRSVMVNPWMLMSCPDALYSSNHSPSSSSFPLGLLKISVMTMAPSGSAASSGLSGTASVPSQSWSMPSPGCLQHQESLLSLSSQSPSSTVKPSPSTSLTGTGHGVSRVSRIDGDCRVTGINCVNGTAVSEVSAVSSVSTGDPPLDLWETCHRPVGLN